jgi:hypothetical protein
MADPEANFGMMDFISTLITLAIMLPIFYFIYLVWWKHDQPLVDGPLAGIVRKVKKIKLTGRIRELDRGNWPRRNPVVITAFIVFIFCLASIPVAGLIGTDDESKFVDREIGADSDTVKAFDNGTITEGGTLTEGSEADYPVGFSANYVISIQVTLSWEDEDPSIIGGTNQPDTFTVQLLDPEGNLLDETSDDAGSLVISWSTGDPEERIYDGDFIVKVKLDIAGDNEGRFGLLGDEDNSNEYILKIQYNSYYYTSGSGDDTDVRWDG